MKKNFILFLIFFLLIFSIRSENNKYYDNIEDAIDYYENQILENKNNVMNYFNLASIYKEFGENRKAFNLYKELMEINDRDPRVHLELAKMYYFIGAYHFAEEEINFFLRRNMINWEIYYWLGCILLEQGKYEEAKEAFNKSIEIDDKKVIPYIKLGEVYQTINNFEEAIKNYKIAIEKDRIYTEELTRKIAYLYEKKGDFSKAFVHWRKVGDIDTKDEEVASKIQKYIATVPEIKEKTEEYVAQKKMKRISYSPPDKISVLNAEVIPIVEIGLLEKIKYIYFKSGSDFLFLNDKNEILFKGEKLKEYFIEVDDKNKKVFAGQMDGNSIEIKEGNYYIKKEKNEATVNIYNVQYGEGFYWSSTDDTTYRGNFKVIFKKNFLTLVNQINVEEYLYGVLPSEMPPHWEMEALKTQAVAARTYTFEHLGRHKKDGFDLCAQQHCAVYKGIQGENERTNKAVDETRGEVLYGSNYKILQTFYSLSCGGHTTDIYDAWGYKLCSSLKGVLDGRNTLNTKWSFPLSPFYLEEWIRLSPDVYCKVEGNYESFFRWIRYMDSDALSFYVKKKYDLGKIKNIKPIKRAKSGAIVKLYIEGEKGSKTVNFDIIRLILGKIRSNVIKWEYRKDAMGYIKDIYIYGAGWGHGIGMCQRGTLGMAKEGKKYNEILYHYFPGSYIKKRY
ncbi:MAG: SpoIID/LytB domain-containing protein [Candidatus Goldbacteria bacterium]|nr:SpoIID/LytB domain-containing protein [Candidatus Goldiibacteriota bacterium]